jgi:hypothetical protein
VTAPSTQREPLALPDGDAEQEIDPVPLPLHWLPLQVEVPLTLS